MRLICAFVLSLTPRLPEVITSDLFLLDSTLFRILFALDKALSISVFNLMSLPKLASESLLLPFELLMLFDEEFLVNFGNRGTKK